MFSHVFSQIGVGCLAHELLFGLEMFKSVFPKKIQALLHRVVRVPKTEGCLQFVHSLEKSLVLGIDKIDPCLKLATPDGYGHV